MSGTTPPDQGPPPVRRDRAVHRTVRAMSGRTKNIIFGTWYVVLILMVTCPPLYLAASGGTPRILSLPLSVFYMVLNGALAILMVSALWVVESIRGEHELFHEDLADGTV
jgi:hypothetical protein